MTVALSPHPCHRVPDAVAGSSLVDGARVRSLADRYGTPVYLYDAQVLERTWRSLRGALPRRMEIFYSIKANPNRELLRFFLDRDCGLEVASGGELQLALEAGCDPARLFFAGPGKTDAELELAVGKGVGEIHTESVNEIRRLGSIARRLDRMTPIALRVNPASDVQGGAVRMGGTAAAFGIDEERLDPAVDAALAEPHLRLDGVHLFTGTQILASDILLAQHRRGIEIARRVAVRQGRPIRTIDFGGGLGIPYFPKECPLDLLALSVGLEKLAAECRADPLLVEARLVVEPGRFLVGSAGLYVAAIVDIKESKGKTFAILDGGMNHHLAASGHLGQTIKRNFPVALIERLDDQASTTVDIVGPLCTPLDVLGRAVHLPEPRVGDLIGVFQSGAYARTASPLGFLSHATPPEVWVDGTSDRLIRDRGSWRDGLRDQQDAGRSSTLDVSR